MAVLNSELKSFSESQTYPLLSCTVKLTHLPKDVMKERLLRVIHRQGADHGMVKGASLQLFNADNEHPYALINYGDRHSCENACSLLNGLEIDGVPMRAKVKGSGSNTSEKPVYSNQPNPLKRPHPPVAATVKVELRGAPTEILQSASDQLFEYFSEFGTVKDKPIIRSGDPFYVYVNFSSEDAATEACTTKSVNLGSIQLKIKPHSIKSSSTTGQSFSKIHQNSPHAELYRSNFFPSMNSELPSPLSHPAVTSGSHTIKVELHGPQAELLSGVDLQKYFEHLVGDRVETVPVIHKGNPHFAYVNFYSPEAAAKASEKNSIVLNQVKVTIKRSTKAKPVEFITKTFVSQDNTVDLVLATCHFNEIEKKLVPFDVSIKPQSSKAGIQVTGSRDNVERAFVLLSLEADVVKSRIVKESRTIDCCAVPFMFSSPDLFETLRQKFGVDFYVLKCTRDQSSVVEEKEAVFVCAMLARYFEASVPPVKLEVLSDYFNANQQKTCTTSTDFGFSWSFQDDNSKFVKMRNPDSKAIEAHYQLHLKHIKSRNPSLPTSTSALKTYTYKVGKSNSYSYDFKNMTQTNRKTKKVRNAVSRSITILCRGLESSVSASFTELKEKLKDSYVQVDLKVEDDFQSKKIFKVANEYLVNVQQLPGKLSLEGERQYVDKLSMEMKVQMTTKSTDRPSSVTDSKGPYWEPQSNDIELKNVLHTSKEWNLIEKRFKETLPGKHLANIQRIQNKWLWGKYAFCRSRMCQKNGEEGVNELLLFHGSRQTAPDSIYRSEHGFDFRFGAHGLWGKGAYFALNANYSDKYAYSTMSTANQIFIAFVLTGISLACPQDSSLDKPPVKNPFTLERYDSINGESGSSKIYIVYDHDKSYPAYLITYR